MAHYLLDSNILIQSEHFIPEDIFPSYWAKLGGLIASGDAVVHETVKDELKRIKDFIMPWLKSIGKVKLMKTSDGCLDRYLELCAWAETQTQYSDQAVRNFETPGRADAMLCAEAWESDLILVTFEVHSNSPNEVKIPDVCDAFGIKCLNGFDFMRTERFRF